MKSVAYIRRTVDVAIIDEYPDGAAIVAAVKPAGDISYSEDIAA